MRHDRLTTRVIVGVLLVIAALGIAQSFAHIAGRRGDIGFGAFPFVASLLLAVLAIAMLATPEPPADESEAEHEHTRRFQLVAAGTILYVVTMPFVGFLVGTIVFFAAEIALVGRMHWSIAAGLAIIFAAPSYAGFVVAMHLPLPHGLWHPFV